MQLEIWLFWVFFSLLLNVVITYPTIVIFRKKIGLHRSFPNSTILLGLLETAFYTICIARGIHSLVAIWLGVKMAGRWTAEKGDKANKNDNNTGKINMFLIGNLLNLFWGLLCGGMIGYLINASKN